jgi:hypothetical protein
MYGRKSSRTQQSQANGAGVVSAERRKKDLQKIAARVMEHLDGIISAMQKAAEQISSGRALEEIDDAGFHLYLARKDQKDNGSRAEAVLCTMGYDEYFRILEEAAAEVGLCLEKEAKLEVTLPDAEFEENMVTGGFERYKGLAVEHHNECLEELMVEVCRLLKERSLAVACAADEDVIFYLPLGWG